MKVKEAKQNIFGENKKGLIQDKTNLQNLNEIVQKNIPKIRKTSFDSLMDQILILDRSIFEYQFIFAKNLLGKLEKKN